MAAATALLVFPPWAPHLEMPECGLAYLKAYLQGRGHAATTLDLNVEFLSRHPEARRGAPEYRRQLVSGGDGLRPASLLLSDVASYVDQGADPWDAEVAPSLLARVPAEASVLGFSLFSATQVPPALVLARRVRTARPDVRIVIGGPWCAGAAHLLPRLLERFPFVDGAVPYDGEGPLDALLAAGVNTPIDDLPGFVTARHVLQAGRPPSVPIAQLPAPDYTELPLALYPHAALALRTRRGCVWGHCVHCVQLHPEDRSSPDCLTPEQTVAHLVHLIQATGRRDFVLCNHTTPAEELDALARAIVRAKLSLGFSAMARFERGFTPEVLSGLLAAGCRSLFFGLEAIEPKDLRKLQKGIAATTASRVIRDATRTGIAVEVSVMAFPGQTSSGFANTLAFLEQHADALHAVTVLRFALPRVSPAYREPDRLGIVPLTAEDDLDVFNLPYQAEVELGLDRFRTMASAFEHTRRGQGH
jgi:hypothetical protein